MSKRKERVEAEEWRRSVQGHSKEAGYAERYYNNVHGQSFWLRKLIEAGLGFVLIVGMTIALLTGWFREAFLGALAIGTVALIVWGWKSIARIRRQNRLHNEAFERQKGIDGRFGRVGAERKKK